MPSLCVVQLAQNRVKELAIGTSLATQITLADSQKIYPLLVKCTSLRQLTLDVVHMDLRAFAILSKAAVRCHALAHLTLCHAGSFSAFREVFNIIEEAQQCRRNALHVTVKIDAPTQRQEAALRDAILHLKPSICLELLRFAAGRWVPCSATPENPLIVKEPRRTPCPPLTARPANLLARSTVKDNRAPCGALVVNDESTISARSYSPPRLRSPKFPDQKDITSIRALSLTPLVTPSSRARPESPVPAHVAAAALRQIMLIQPARALKHKASPGQQLSKPNQLLPIAPSVPSALPAIHVKHIAQRVSARISSIEQEIQKQRAEVQACLQGFDRVCSSIDVVKLDLARLL